MPSGFSYAAGRACAVFTRPLCLYLANNFLAAGDAQGLAIVFLASALALVVVAADPHRRFYERFFTTPVTVNGLTVYLYFASVLLLAVLGVTGVFVATWQLTHLAALAAAAAFYYATEKLVDEVLRLRLFERRFDVWGNINILRTGLQLLAVAGVWLAFGRGAVAWQLALVLAAGNLLAIWRYLPAGMFRALAPARLAMAARLLARAARSLVSNWTLWVLTVASAGVGYLDRLVALVLDRAALPLFMLVVMCFSVVLMAVDFFFVSRHRRDFLEGRVTMRAAFTRRDFAASILGGLMVAIVACVLVLKTSRDGAQFPLEYVLVIGLLQLAVALTLIPREIVYWTRHFRWILAVEITFWMLFFAAVFALWSANSPPLASFAAAVACTVVRLMLFVILAHKASAGTAQAGRLGIGT